MMIKKRDVSLDYAKGFAILLIVIYHLYGYTGRYYDSCVYSFCHTVQLAIFMFVSGVLIDKSQNSLNLKSKAIRLLFPFFSFYIIWGVIDYHNFVLFFLAEFKLGYWFLLVLFELMSLYALMYHLSIKIKIPSIVLHVIFYFLLSFYELIYPKDNIFNMIFCTNLLWHYYPFFMLGIHSRKYKYLLAKKYSPIYLVLFVFTQYFYFTIHIKALAPMCNLFSLLFFMSIFVNNILPFETIIAKFGKFSMQIYLLHFIVLSFIVDFIPIQNNRLQEFLLYLFFAIVIANSIIVISRLIMKDKWASLLLFGINYLNNKDRNS